MARSCESRSMIERLQNCDHTEQTSEMNDDELAICFSPAHQELSRELEIFQYVLAGKTNKAIANEITVSP